MIVYRVENIKGRGPYYSESVWTNRCHKYPLHPTPKVDISIWPYLEDNEQIEYFFGFESMDDLRNWFDEQELSALHSLDFYINKYKVSVWDTLKGQRQIAFIKDNAKLINSMEIVAESLKVARRDY